jgi:hypothetical protein
MTAEAAIPASDATTGYRRVAGSPRYAFIEIKPDYARLDAILGRIKGLPGALERVIPPALNQAASEERTWLSREFGARMVMQRKRSIPDRLTLAPKAGRASWSAGIRIALTRFTLGSFQDVKQTPSGVTWSTGGTHLSGGFIPRAFLRLGLTHYLTGQYIEGRQVWRRAQQGEKGFSAALATRAGGIVRRYPIKMLRGPSLAKVFSADANFQADAERQGTAILEKKLASQVDRLAAEVAK